MKLTPICVALATALAAGGAQAATKTEQALMKRLEQLAAELNTVKSELATLKTQKAEAPKTVATTVTTPTAPTLDTRTPTYSSAPLAAAAPAAQPVAAPAEPRTTVFGYGEVNYNRPFRDQSATQMDVRRAIIGITHQASDKTRIVGEFEFEHAIASASDSGEAAVEQLYVEHRLNDNMGLKGGLFLIPLGYMNLSHEPRAYYGVERNFVETAIIPTTWRETGVSAFGVSDAGLRWDVGLTSGFDLSKWDATTTEGKESPLGAIHQEGSQAKGKDLSVYGALSWRGTPGLDVGIGAFTGKAAHKTAGFAAPDTRVTLWDAHARWTPGKWDLTALYARGNITNTDLLNVSFAGQTLVPKSFYGWYTQAAYALWQNSEYALNPFVRYEVYNTAAAYAPMPAGLETDAQRDEKVTTVGANLKVGENVVLKADVQRFQLDRSRDRLNLGLGYQF